MIAALTIVIVVQALTLCAVALRDTWSRGQENSPGQENGPDTVGGEMLQQDEEDDDIGAEPTIGFRGRGARS